MRDEWNEQRARFDADFDKAQKVTAQGMAVVSVCLLVFFGVLIWAIIRLVLHFT